MLLQRFQKQPVDVSEQQWWNEATQDSTEGQSWEALSEGQLMVDVYDRPDAIVIRSLIAGVDASDLEISLHDDMLTVRGTRNEHEEVADDQFYHRECYWGSFSRTVIIPTPVHHDKIKAFSKNGVVVIVLPKVMKEVTGIAIQTEDDYLDNPID